jgi:hypothetical protein
VSPNLEEEDDILKENLNDLLKYIYEYKDSVITEIKEPVDFIMRVNVILTNGELVEITGFETYAFLISNKEKTSSQLESLAEIYSEDIFKNTKVDSFVSSHEDANIEYIIIDCIYVNNSG